MNLKENIRNSLRAFVMADALGVPFEFRKQGSFYCSNFTSGGVHRQAEGVWSDDSSVTLCLIDALSKRDKDLYSQIPLYRNNLKRWFYNQEFNAGSGVFDIGNQTRTALIIPPSEETPSMGNGALFYALPIAAMTSFDDYTEVSIRKIFKEFCKTTHFNQNCFEFGSRFCLLIRKLLLDLPIESSEIEAYQNKGDVINTYNLVIDNFLKLQNEGTTLFQDICAVVDLGEDTDTNAALFAALMGTKKKISERDWARVKKYKKVDMYIDTFVNSFEVQNKEKCFT